MSIFRTIALFVYLFGYMIVHYSVLCKAERALAAGDTETVRQLVKKHIPHWSKGILNVTGVRLSVEGLDNIPKDGPCVFVANHRSYYDIPLLLAGLDEPYGILAKVRVHLFDAIDRISPAFLIGRETGDLLNIAVSDIETLEFFFAHTIGPMFTVVLLPVTTIALAFSVHPLYGWLLIPVYLMISVVLPLLALKAGRGIGMRYRQRLGTLKSKILESVYGIRDIQIFGAVDRKTAEVLHANEEVNRAYTSRASSSSCAPACCPPGASTAPWAPSRCPLRRRRRCPRPST